MNSEEQYKHVEDRIKEAASAADYVFEESSWKKMEALLDKEEKKRRPFYWIFGLLLLGGLIIGGAISYQLVNNPSQTPKADKERTADESRKEKKTENLPYNKSSSNAEISLLGEQTEHEKNNPQKTTPSNTNKKGKETLKYPIRNKPNTSHRKEILADIFKTSIPIIGNNSTIRGSKKTNKEHLKENTRLQDQDKQVYTEKSKFSVQITSPVAETDALEIQNSSTITNKTDQEDLDQVQNNQEPAAVKRERKIKIADTSIQKKGIDLKTTTVNNKKQKHQNGFYLFGIGRPELNSTRFLAFKHNPVTLAYGAGIGYQFNHKISLQTGFFTGAKKYLAGPNDYRVKPGSYLSTVKIIQIDANCRVFEIPLTIQYNFLSLKKINYFAAAGITSYLMKKEKYLYTYERYNVRYSYPRDYTKNSHLFAAVQVSAGFEKQIGRKLFIQAAPVFTIPLQGVGEGHVKIFSTGLQAGIKYFPL